MDKLPCTNVKAARCGTCLNCLEANQSIEWTRVNNDVNGNPRYVCHFLTFCTDADNGDYTSIDLSAKYAMAVKRAKKLGGRKFHNKQYGGGIVFQSYNINDLEQDIKALMAKLAID